MALNPSSSLKAMTLALAGAALVPGEAEACSPDYCSSVDGWHSLDPINSQLIPTDGVLVLQGARSGYSTEEDWLDKIDLTVTRDGQPIAGAVEVGGVANTLLWRPAAPLEPGGYKVTGSLDNPDEDSYENCAPDLTLDFGFMVDAGPSAPLTPPVIEASSSLLIDESDDLEDLVCCDGAVPFRVYGGGCGDYDEYVEWGEGFCAPLRAFGTLRVEVATSHELSLATLGMVTRQLVVDGQPRRGQMFDNLAISDSKPFCTAVRLTNLATGETWQSEETCHGNEPDVAAQLGDHAIDPGPALAMECQEGAYTCQILEDDDRWDQTQCAPWLGDEATSGDPTEGPTTGGPGSDGSDGSDGSGGPASGGADGLVEHGCACDSATPSPLAALALLGLGLLRPRRRRRPPG